MSEANKAGPNVKGTGSTDTSAQIRLAVEGEGSAAKDSITDRLLDDLDAKLQTQSGKEMSDDDIREWMVNRREQIEKEVTYKDGEGFKYEYGRAAFKGTLVSLTPDQLRFQDEQRVVSMTSEREL